mmetsp:Transcript_12320/g.25969  ORF Transcript_12320/g.25969 Transcript_12320/m.25969 type:complete len:89 (-) Transcript_12320:2217-2483(-)
MNESHQSSIIDNHSSIIDHHSSSINQSSSSTVKPRASKEAFLSSAKEDNGKHWLATIYSHSSTRNSNSSKVQLCKSRSNKDYGDNKDD